MQVRALAAGRSHGVFCFTPIMLGGAKDSCFWSGAKAGGPKSEAQRAESGGGVLGGGAAS